MTPCTLTFKAPKKPTLFTSGSTAIELDPGFRLALRYDFRPSPLILTADAHPGDEIRLTLTDAHIALFVNGELCDEEWPCGKLDCDFSALSDGVTYTEGVDEASVQLRTGISAAELRRPGVNVGDCMPFAGSDGRYHLYWLYDRHHHRSKWGLGAHQWAHASTTDLVHWDEHPMAVAITEQYEGSICTGSTIEAPTISDCGESVRTYCWYAIRMWNGTPARLTYSVSDDGFNFTKSGKYFTLPERYHQSSARDPKVVFDGEKYHMIVTTTLLSTGHGCLAHLVSEHADMSDFTDLGPLYEGKSDYQPECADYFEFAGRYYLVCSGYYFYSDKPFGEGGWTAPANNKLDCGLVPKAAFCPWNNELVFTGFISEGGYAGRIVMKRATALDDGRLVLAEIEQA